MHIASTAAACGLLDYSINSTRLVTFNVLSTARQACQALLFDKLDTAKMYGLDTSNMSSRDVMSQVEFGLMSMPLSL